VKGGAGGGGAPPLPMQRSAYAERRLTERERRTGQRS
jgi:hypothetical protein